MGLMAWFYRQLERGTEVDVDPDDDSPAYLAMVPIFQAGLLVESLRLNGIDASYTEATNPAAESLTNGKVYVPLGQLAAARAFLDSPEAELNLEFELPAEFDAEFGADLETGHEELT